MRIVARDAEYVGISIGNLPDSADRGRICKRFAVTLDWAQGSYTFEYKKKIVDLKVYESAPKDAISLFGDVPAALSGPSIMMPSMSA